MKIQGKASLEVINKRIKMSLLAAIVLLMGTLFFKQFGKNALDSRSQLKRIASLIEVQSHHLMRELENSTVNSRICSQDPKIQSAIESLENLSLGISQPQILLKVQQLIAQSKSIASPCEDQVRRISSTPNHLEDFKSLRKEQITHLGASARELQTLINQVNFEVMEAHSRIKWPTPVPNAPTPNSM